MENIREIRSQHFYASPLNDPKTKISVWSKHYVMRYTRPRGGEGWRLSSPLSYSLQDGTPVVKTEEKDIFEVQSEVPYKVERLICPWCSYKPKKR